MTKNAIDTFINIENAAHDGAFGSNPRATPTDAQAKTGNYKLGKATIYGLPVAIEQPRHSYRTGQDPGGKRWENKMAAHYGYFSGTRGADGDGVDCFIGFYPQSEQVYIINQYVNGKFDEHKVCLCFPDEETAKRAYLDSYDKGWNGLHSIITASITQFKWWLKNGNMNNQIALNHLPFEGLETMKQRVAWDNTANPIGTALHKVLYEIRRADSGENLIFDSVCMADIMADADEVMALDAMVTPYAKLERKMQVLRTVMDRHSETIKVEAVQISDPFKQSGVAQVAVIFELSDGQTVSIFFHNPDVDPRKIQQSDELISWAWRLNKRDITVVVAPERGQDLNITEVAARIMKLADKNSAAFIRANSKRAENMQAIEDIKTEIVSLEQELKDVQHELEVAKVEAENNPFKGDDKVDAAAIEGYEPTPIIDPVAAHEAFKQATLQALIDKFGWTNQSTAGGPLFLVTREIGGGNKGGMMNPEGIRRVSAKINGNSIDAMHGDNPLVSVPFNADLTAFENAKNLDDAVNAVDPNFVNPDPIVDLKTGPVIIPEPETEAGLEEEVAIEKDASLSPVITIHGNDYTEMNINELEARESMESALENSGGVLFDAAKYIYQEVLKHRYIKTSIGDVFLTGYGWQKLKEGLKKDDIRAKTIPFIPVILSSGEIGKPEELYKDRPDGIIAFHPFTLIVKIDEYLSVKTTLKVGERADHKLVYHLRSNEHDDALDSTNDNPRLARLLPGIPGVDGILDSAPGETLSNQDAEINLIIVEVYDKDGNRHPELEDDVGQEGHEVVERPTPSDTGIEQSLIDAYDAAYIKAADKITTAVTEINWDAIIDTNTADIEAHQLKEKVGNGEEIKQARKNLEDAGIDYQLAVIAELPGLSLYSQAIVNGRDAIDKIYEAGKKGLIKSGKEKLANLPEDATLEEKAAAVFAAKGIQGYAGEKVVNAIREKDVESLRSILGNTDNKASRTIFEMATGIKLEKTVKGTLPQIDEWAGITPEQRAAIEAEKQAAREADNLLSELKYAWNPLEYVNVMTSAGNATMQDWLVALYGSGYTHIETRKKGAATTYWLVNKEHKAQGFNKSKVFNAFLKAALAFGEGDNLLAMKKALKALGVDVAEKELTPVERVNAAYSFNADDDFKEWLAESIDKAEQSPFLTAKAMDEAAKRNGADIEWGFFGGAALDGGTFALKPKPIAFDSVTGAIVEYSGLPIRWGQSDKYHVRPAGDMNGLILVTLDSVAGDNEADIALVDEDELGATFTPDSGDEAVFDDSIISYSESQEPVSWLGFKLANEEMVRQQAAEVLPSAEQISGDVYLGINDTKNGGDLFVAGTIVGVKFTAMKVFYTVAVVVSPQPKDGVNIYAIIPDVDSTAVRPRNYLELEGNALDSVSSEYLLQIKKSSTFDLAVLDAVDQDGYVGKITKDGAVVGRIDMGDDGKALVFVGESGDKRVKFASGVEARYSDDDADEMVDSLFNIPQADADVITESESAEVSNNKPEQSEAEANQEWIKVGRVEFYKSTGKFVAIENGTNKNIGADGGLVSSYVPTLYDTKEDAENAVKNRYERNKSYEAENTPEKQAERKEQHEQEKQQRQQALELAIEEALKIIPADGYSLARHGNSIQVIGKFNEELHSRLKRAGAMWDSETKSWFIQSDKANTGLQKAFKNFESAIVKKADQQAETERLELEAEKQAAIDKKTKEDDERKKQPTIEQGEYGDFYVSPVPNGYRVSFDYDADNVDKIKSLSHRSYNPDTKKWFVDALSATELKKILDQSAVDAAKRAEESKVKIEQGRALSALRDAEMKRQIDEEQANGIIRISRFYSPYQAVPAIGDVIAHKGDKFVIIQVDAHQLTKKALDWEEDAGQPGLDYGTLRVTIKAQRIDNESETESEPVPVPGDSDETITPSVEEPGEVDNPAEEQIDETKTVEDLAPAITGNTELDKQRAKLRSLADLQERMKAANKVVNNKKLSDEQKVEQLMEQGFTKGQSGDILKPDYANRVGFAGYQLTNNNAVIKSTQKRIEQLEAKELAESLAASGERETSYDFDGGTIDMDYGDDRLRVNFDSKPDADMIGKLKQNGFKWSYTNTAWQRQLTDNAISTANYLFGTQIKTAASAMKDEVNKPRGDVIVPAPETQPQGNPMKEAFIAELNALKAETDTEAFDRRLDEIAGRIEGAGLMEELDAELNAAADVLTALLAEAEKAA